MAIANAISRNIAVALSALLWLAPGASACDETPISIHCGSTPSSALGGDGALLTVFVDDGHVYFTRAERETLDFAPPVRISGSEARIDHNGESRPKIALGHDDAVYVSWTRRIEGQFAGDVYFSRSLDGGRSFEGPRLMRDTAEPSSHRFDTLAVTPAGRLFVAWIDKREQAAAEASGEDFAGASIFFAISDDQGASFSPNQRAAAHACECCRLAAVPADDHHIRLLWRHVFDGSIRDHALAKLGANGASAMERVSFEGWSLQGCPHEGPHMAAGEEGVHMVWFSGAPDAGGVHYGYRHHGGAGTDRLQHFDDRPGAGKPQVAARGGHVDVVWLAVGAERSELLHVHSHDAGRSWSTAQPVAASAGAVDHPQLLTDGNSVWVAWHTEDEGYRLLAPPEPVFQAP